RRHTRSSRDWSSDVCPSDLAVVAGLLDAGVDSLRGDAPLPHHPDELDVPQLVALSAQTRSKPLEPCHVLVLGHLTVRQRLALLQIGRASRREGMWDAGAG